MINGSKGVTKVRTASRSTGGVVISDSSRTPVSASCSVRGIGVADSVRTWTSARSSFSRSLWATPKCCSSSTTTRARSRKVDRLAEERVRADDDVDRAVGKPRLDLLHLGRGHEARGVRDLDRQAAEALLEGAGNAGGRAASSARRRRPACRPSPSTKAARSATSVLPKPTSPQTRRSIGRPTPRSSMTASIALCWSSVSS